MEEENGTTTPKNFIMNYLIIDNNDAHTYLASMYTRTIFMEKGSSPPFEEQIQNPHLR